MAIEFEVLKKNAIGTTDTFATVDDIARRLRAHLDEERIQQLLRERHIVGASSAEIQDIILEGSRQLGFHSEKKSLFSSYGVAALRPDYFRPVIDTGILLEVERGKTIANNMDLLDLWKCHICPYADYLFLVVPKLRPDNNGKTLPQFSHVLKRLAPFFEERNYVNIEAVYLFGY